VCPYTIKLSRALGDDEPLVREHAAWARRRLVVSTASHAAALRTGA
jgi:hypothetical protein